MAHVVQDIDVRHLPLAPKNPLPFREQVQAMRAFHTGPETLRDAGGPVTRVSLGPKALVPQVVFVTSPQGAHDVLGRAGAAIDKTRPHREFRRLLGANLFDLEHDRWLPRRRAIQPVFTKRQVQAFAGHMSEAAATISARWAGGRPVDLDAECRAVAMRAFCRSVLGLDLDEHTDRIGEALRVALSYVADRGARPLNAPSWLPTPTKRRAEDARTELRRYAEDILRGCRTDETREAPLVRALMAATDPDTGRPLSDDAIRDELIVFLLAGHDTTATTLAYALWAIGRNPQMQHRVAKEVAALGDRALSTDDVSRLPYTICVLHEALRLCPPGASIGREATQDVAVDGYRVERGTMLIVGVYALHRDPALWERPLDFVPDRFADDSSRERSRWQYMPFGAGPRSCIGDHFAMLAATLALATIVQKSEIDSLTENFEMVVPFTTVAAEPIIARVTARVPVTD